MTMEDIYSGGLAIKKLPTKERGELLKVLSHLEKRIENKYVVFKVVKDM